MEKNPYVRIGVTPFKASSAEEYLIESMREHGFAKNRDHMYGSTAAFCPRLNFAYATQDTIPTEMSAESALYMQIGNGIEAALCDGLRNKGKLLYSNLRLPPMKPYIGGKVDLVYLGPKDEIKIGEVKSCGELPMEPKYSYMRQLLTYLAIGGYRTGDLIFVSRNVVNKARKVAIRSFEANVTEASLIEVLAQICYTQKCIEMKLFPPIPAHFKKSVHCGWCMYKDSCWKEGTDFDHYRPLGEGKAEVEALAKEQATKLFAKRDERYVESLRQIFRDLPKTATILRDRVVAEIETFEPFGDEDTIF